MRWQNGAAAQAYPEHVIHGRDLRDVPVQGLVEIVGRLPGAERGRRGMLTRAWNAEAAGCRQGGRLACGGKMGQRPGRTLNMPYMFVTCKTSQSRGWLKLEAPCQVRRGDGEKCSGMPGVQRRRAPGKAGGLRAVERWSSGPGVHRTCNTCS